MIELMQDKAKQSNLLAKNVLSLLQDAKIKSKFKHRTPKDLDNLPNWLVSVNKYLLQILNGTFIDSKIAKNILDIYKIDKNVFYMYNTIDKVIDLFREIIYISIDIDAKNIDELDILLYNPITFSSQFLLIYLKFIKNKGYKTTIEELLGSSTFKCVQDLASKRSYQTTYSSILSIYEWWDENNKDIYLNFISEYDIKNNFNHFVLQYIDYLESTFTFKYPIDRESSVFTTYIKKNISVSYGDTVKKIYKDVPADFCTLSFEDTLNCFKNA